MKLSKCSDCLRTKLLQYIGYIPCAVLFVPMTFIYLFVYLFLLIIVDIQSFISFKCTTQWFTDTEVYFCSSLQNRRHIIFNMHKKRTKKILLCTCTDVISVH